jgi:hypothetical protein
MQKILRLCIRNIINEALQTRHYTERVFNRLIDTSEITVGYENQGQVGVYTEVGTYILPNELKTEIVENTKLVENYNFPKNKSYAVKIANIPIDINKISFFQIERNKMYLEINL